MERSDRNLASISRSMAFLRRDYTLNEERIFLNTCILARCNLDGDGKYSGEFGDVSAIRDGNGIPVIYEMTFNAKKIMGADVKDGAAYKQYDKIREAFRSYNRKHLYALAPNGVDWIDLPPFAITLSDIRGGKIYTKVLPEVWELFASAGGFYNRIDMVVAYRLSSQYSLRMYEMFGSLDHPLEVNIGTLKQYWKLEDSYRNNNDFLRWIVYKSFGDLAKENIFIPFTVNRAGKGRTARIKSITIYPHSNRGDLICAARRQGVDKFLGHEEAALLLRYFRTDEVVNNIDVFLHLKWRTKENFTAKIVELAEKARDKRNPRGWIIDTLRGLPSRPVPPLVKEIGGKMPD